MRDLLLLPEHTGTDCLWCRGLRQQRITRGRHRFRTLLYNLTGISLVGVAIVWALERLP